jgi:Ras-related protein Rab-6A
LSKTLYLEDRTIRLQLWDTAGQERFRTLIPSYIRDAAVTVIVYDVTQRSSFDSVDQWIADVREERGDSMDEVTVVLVANKADALEEERQVTAGEGEEKARQLGVSIFMETSAKSGVNVKGLFMRIAGALPVVEPPQVDSAKGGASQLIDVRLSGADQTGAAQQRCAC